MRPVFSDLLASGLAVWLVTGAVATPLQAAALQAAPPEQHRQPERSPLERGSVLWRTTLDGWQEPTSAIRIATAAGDVLLVADPAEGSVGLVLEDTRVGRLPVPPGVVGWRPLGLARGISRAGEPTVLVADAVNRRIDRFAAAGDDGSPPLSEPAGARWRWLESVDLGSTPLAPSAVAETEAGILFIDAISDRLFLLEEGSADAVGAIPLDGAEIPGGWGRPTDLAVAADGRIFVTDADRHRVIRLDPAGRLLGTFGERGPFPGLFQEPAGLDLVGDRLYVADRLNHRISIFDLDGRPQGQWGMHAVIPRQGEGRIHYPVDVAVASDASGATVVEPFERRVQVFEAAAAGDDGPGTVAELPSLDGVTSHFGSGIAADRDLVVLWEPETAAVVVFDWRDEVPIHVTSFGGPGRAADRFGRVSAAAVAGSMQRIALADPGLDRLAFVDLDRDPERSLRLDPFMGRTAGTVAFDRIATQVAALTDEDREAVPPLEPVDLAWLADGSLLLLDRRLGRVLALSPMPPSREGHVRLPSEVAAVWGPGGSGGDAFAAPIAMSPSPAGDAVAVLDAGGPETPARVVTLSLAGVPRAGFDLPSSLGEPGRGPFTPGGIVWTEHGFVVSDRLGDRLLLLDEQGTLRHEVGTTGTADGELWSPQGLAVREDGTVIVVDKGNHRVQGFAAEDGGWRIVFSLGRASTRQRPPGPPGAKE